MRTGRLALVALVAVACKTSGSSDRPPTGAPPPSTEAIRAWGFDDAVRLGSDYVYASQETPSALQSSEQLPGGIWRLRYGLMPKGSGRMLEVEVEGPSGRVIRSRQLGPPGPAAVPPLPKAP